jgi:phosphoribosyl 1,2-cyclic phosphodiesterase
MKVRFWGVRGSLPTPLTPSQIQNKITAVVQRIKQKDIQDTESRVQFLHSLPPFLFGTVGGNTTSIEIRLSDDTLIIIDCGSGIRELANSLKIRREHIRNYHIFFTHFHWDHIMGLPFFTPQAYDPRCSITFYSPVKGFESFLREQMKYPYFPITMDVMNATLRFVEIENSPMKISNALIYWKEVKHPGGCYSYKFVEQGKAFIFSTDTELTEKDFVHTEENTGFYEKVDVLAIDSQYTLDEAIEKYNWGHSSYSMTVDFATEWKIKHLVLFHHEPLYQDNKIYSILNSAKWYKNHLESGEIRISIAREEMEIQL